MEGETRVVQRPEHWRAHYKRRTAESSAAYLLPHLHPGQTLLDVGRGPGTIPADFARLVAPGVLAALDNASGAIRCDPAGWQPPGEVGT
jgi:ubiquinone/menaquinone biosynthesis C-methylase UbiE